MNLIAAVDENWGIGCGGKLLASIPEDMKYFRQKTEGKVVVMGHSTLKSLPYSKPLKNRVNIVLSKNKDLLIDNAIVCNSIEKLFEAVAGYNYDGVFVIGGQEIYNLLIPYCNNAFITKIFHKFPADKFFPNIDNLKNWSITWQSERKTHNGIDYMFFKYTNSNPSKL